MTKKSLDNQQRVLFLGNCQALNMLTHSRLEGVSQKYYLFPSPQLSSRSIEETRSYLRQHLSDDELKSYVKSSRIRISPSIDDLGTNVDTLVLSLFHESPLYVHRSKGYAFEFHINSHVMTDGIRLQTTLAEECDQYKPNHHTYFSRYYSFLSALRMKYKEARLVLLLRLPHTFSPEPVLSWFDQWEEIEQQSRDFIIRCKEGLGVEVVDLHSVLKKCYSAGLTMDNLFPLTASHTLETDSIQLSFIYDLEHPSDTFWNYAGEILADKLGVGQAPLQRDEPPVETPIESVLIHSIFKGRFNDFLEKLAELPPHRLHDMHQVILSAVCLAQTESFIHGVYDVVDKATSSSSDLYNLLEPLKKQLACLMNVEGRTPKMNVAVWGAGGRCREILHSGILDEVADISCIIDNNASKLSPSLQGIPVIHPTQFVPGNYPNLESIIVASTFFPEIRDEINKRPCFSGLKVENSPLFSFAAAVKRNSVTIKEIPSNLLSMKE